VSDRPSLARRLVAEGVGTAMLLATVIGSGIMAERLSGGNEALALLCNTLPTGAILTVLILIFGPVSGAHFNPAVSLAFALRGHRVVISDTLDIAAVARTPGIGDDQTVKGTLLGPAAGQPDHYHAFVFRRGRNERAAFYASARRAGKNEAPRHIRSRKRAVQRKLT